MSKESLDVLRDEYNLAWEKSFGDKSISRSSSLDGFMRFLKNGIIQISSFDNFLEVGVGKRPHLLSHINEYCDYTGIDWSSSAIDSCRDLYETSNRKFLNLDVTHDNINGEFGFVLDSHVLHNIPFIEYRKRYLDNIYQALTPGGVFCVETMISHKELSFDFDQSYDPSTCCVSDFLESDVPRKIILNSNDIEKEFLSSNFKIKFFQVFNNLSFIPHSRRSEVERGDPRVLRIVALKE